MKDYKRDSRPDKRRGGSQSFSSGGNRERSIMYKTICSECGKSCEVPFKPTNTKPVYCNNCFSHKKPDEGYSNNRSFGNNRSSSYEEKQLFTATCSNCGRSCEVPFRPSGNKPVYCSNCFERKDENVKGNDNNEIIEEIQGQMEILEEKLDRIIALLEAPKKKETKPKAKKAAVSEPEV